MIKNIYKLLIAFILTNSFLLAQDLSLVSGYQLKGAIDNIDPTKFNNSCAKYIFKYDNATKSWKAHISDGEDYGYTGETIDLLKRNEGFWVMGDAPCDVKVNDKQDTILPTGTPYMITSDKLDIVENEKDIIFILSKGSSNYTYSISGGSEHRFFTVGSQNGLLSFKDKPDFENPLDSDKNNIYRVDIEVSDGTLSSQKSFFITVIDDTNDIFKIVSKPLLYNYNTKLYVYEIKTLNASGTVTCFDGTMTYPYLNDDNPGEIRDVNIGSGTLSVAIRDANHYSYSSGKVAVSISCKDESNTILTQTFDVEITTDILAPTVDDISVEVRSNEQVSIPLSGSFDGNSSMAINYVIETQPTNGTIFQKDDNAWWYRSNYNYIGADSFTYKGSVIPITDEYSNFSSIKTVTIDVLNSNRRPEIEDQNLTINEEQELTINLSAYDYEQDLLAFTVVNNSVKNGTLTKIDNTTYKYLPNKDFEGSENIIYTVNDGTSTSHEAKINITVTNVNDKPVIKIFSHIISPKYISEETSLLLDNQSLFIRQSRDVFDVEGDDLTFIVVSEPKNGTLKMYATGGYVYIPNREYAGADSFSYKAYDGTDYSDIATVSIEIEAIENRASREIPATGSTYSLNSLDDGAVKRGTPKDLVRDDAGFIVDNVTKLMWMDNGENLVDSETLHPQTYGATQDNVLPDSIKFDIKKVSYSEADSYCQALSLGGYNDWRIPKRLEVATLRDYGKERDQAIYNSIIGTPTWRSGTAALPDNSFKYASHPILKMMGIIPIYEDRSFYIDAPNIDGTREVLEYESSGTLGIYGMTFDGDLVHADTHGFMCVRGSYTTDPVLYENQDDGVVLDTTTSQMWHNSLDITSGTPEYTTSTLEELSKTWAVPFVGNFDEVIDHCSVSTVGGFNDWVLPNINEMKSLDSDMKFNSTLLYASKPGASLDMNKYFAATKLHHSLSYTSTLNKDQIAKYDPYKYISYDNNETFVSGTYLPFYLDETYSDIFNNAELSDDIILNGVNYNPCLPFRDTTAVGAIGIYEGSQEKAECLDAYSKGCLFDGSLQSECKIQPAVNFNQAQYSSKTLQLGDKYGWSYSNNITRCVRKASTTDVTTFFEKINQKELNIAPISTEFTSNEVDNSFLNALTGKTDIRIVDNGDGTLRDKMRGLDVPKNILATIPKDVNDQDTTYTWDEAIVKVKEMNDANYLGGNWRLPREEDIDTIALIGDKSSIYSYSSNENIKNNIDGDISIGHFFWLAQEDRYDSSKAFSLIYSSTTPKTTAKTEKKALAVVRSDILDANIDRTVVNIESTKVFTLQAPNSYLGFEENISKVNYKWEQLEKYLEGDKNTINSVEIQNATSAVATVTFPAIDTNEERRFQLTLTRDDSSLISTDIISIYVYNKNLVKLASDGTVLPYDANEWSCIKDVSNNLIWESKDEISTSDSFKDKLFTYDDAVSHASSSTLCGVNNWRVPTQQEFNKAKSNKELVNYTGTVSSQRWGYQLVNKDRYWTTFDEVTIPNVDMNNNGVDDYVWTSSDGNNDNMERKTNVPLNKSEVLSADNNTTTLNFAAYATTLRVENHRVWLVGTIE